MKNVIICNQNEVPENCLSCRFYSSNKEYFSYFEYYDEYCNLLNKSIKNVDKNKRNKECPIILIYTKKCSECEVNHIFCDENKKSFFCPMILKTSNSSDEHEECYDKEIPAYIYSYLPEEGKLFFDCIEMINWNEKQFSEIIEKIDLNKFKELFKEVNESQLKYYQSVVGKDENCFEFYEGISNKFIVLSETFKNSLSEKELNRLLSFTKYFQVQIEKILFIKPRKTKNIVHIDIVNGYYGWTSLCEENVSMASDNFELFLEDLNNYLRRIKENGLI